MAREIYHERQKLQFCLLHALNNLFQKKDSFTRLTLNEIAEKLVLDEPNYKEKWTPFSLLFKPHHNALTGNYDINVLIAALEDKGKNVVWHDRRKGANAIDLDHDDDDGLMGIVLNVPVKRFAGMWKSRHWVTLRKINGVWYDLDSDLVAPQAFQDSGKVREFLDFIIGLGGEVLLVMNNNPHWTKRRVETAVMARTIPLESLDLDDPRRWEGRYKQGVWIHEEYIPVLNHEDGLKYRQFYTRC